MDPYLAAAVILATTSMVVSVALVVSREAARRRERLNGIHNAFELRAVDFESRLSDVEKLATGLEEVDKTIKSLTAKFNHDLRDAKSSLEKRITELRAQVAEQRTVVKKLQDTPDRSDVIGSVSDLRRTQGEAE